MTLPQQVTPTKLESMANQPDPNTGLNPGLTAGLSSGDNSQPTVPQDKVEATSDPYNREDATAGFLQRVMNISSGAGRGTPTEQNTSTAATTSGLSSKGDSGAIATPLQYNDVHQNNTSVPAIADQVDKPVGDQLAAYTQSKAGTEYSFGSKNSSSGGIDCSGWTAESTLKTMAATNQAKGTPVYDVARMSTLMHQDAESQVMGVGKIAGFLPEQQVRTGQVPNGTIIGIRRPNVPDFAQGRAIGISHVVQVAEQNGQKMISQSGSHGVTLTPYNDWIQHNDIKAATLYASNPFNVVSNYHNSIGTRTQASDPQPKAEGDNT